MKQVLLVSRDLAVGAPIADELEGAGYELSWCPGPRGPGYICIGGRGKSCPIAMDADAVVLDGWLAADEARKGAPSWHMVLYYRKLGLPVVYLVGPDAPPGPAPDEHVVMLPRRSAAIEVLHAVENVLDRSSSVRAS